MFCKQPPPPPPLITASTSSPCPTQGVPVGLLLLGSSENVESLYSVQLVPILTSLETFGKDKWVFEWGMFLHET